MLNLFSMETNADIKLITHREASNSGDVNSARVKPWPRRAINLG